MKNTEKTITPDWATAPEWAKYYAKDLDGRECWFESMPYADLLSGLWLNSGVTRYLNFEYYINPEKCIDWQNSLQKRS